MPSFDPSTVLLDLDDKPLRTDTIAAGDRGTIAKEQGRITGLPEAEKPEAQLALALMAEEAREPLTVGRAIMTALTQPTKEDGELSASRKLDLMLWAIKVKTALNATPVERVEFANADMDTIKSRVNKTYLAPLVVGQVMQAITD